MTLNRSGIVVSKTTPADHNFPDVLADHLVQRGWTITPLDAERVSAYPDCTHDFDQLLSHSDATVIFSINYHLNLAKLAIDHQIRYIFWGEVYPLSPIHHTFPETADIWCFDASPLVADIWKQQGIPSHYLPLGFNSIVYQPHGGKPDIEVSFVGSGLGHYRARLSKLLNMLEGQLLQVANSPTKRTIFDHIFTFFRELLSTSFTRFASYDYDYNEFIASYLKSLSCDPILLTAIEGTIQHYAYLGQAYFSHRQRVEYLLAAAQVCRLTIYGLGWENTGLQDCVVGPISYSDAPEVISRSKISLNLQRYYHIGVGDRLFNIPACGSLMLSNDFPELHNFFHPGEHLAVFQSPEVCQEQIAYFLNNESERKALARKGLEHAHNNYTFDKQLSKLLEISSMD